MRTAHIGSLEVSVIGLGCNNFGRALDQEGTNAVVAAALDCGITFFDTSSNYGSGQSEGFLGNALGSHRDEVVIGTKFGQVIAGMEGSGGARPDYVRKIMDRSLAGLKTDRIDLYQLHMPDPNTPIADTLGAMFELIEEGKALEIGCSNLDATQLAEALAISDAAGRPRFLSNQIEYSMINRAPETNGLAGLAADEGVALLPYYPLASGLLTGKKRKGEEVAGRLNMDRYQHFLTDRNYDIVEGLRRFAAARNLTPAAVALGWLLAQPTVPSVTPGATRPDQVAANAAAADWRPTAEDLSEIELILEGDSG
jgi:aryl-alcohol dehydrogenase-like predicted oxidoreductase